MGSSLLVIFHPFKPYISPQLEILGVNRSMYPTAPVFGSPGGTCFAPEKGTNSKRKIVLQPSFCRKHVSFQGILEGSSHLVVNNHG